MITLAPKMTFSLLTNNTVYIFTLTVIMLSVLLVLLIYHLTSVIRYRKKTELPVTLEQQLPFKIRAYSRFKDGFKRFNS